MTRSIFLFFFLSYQFSPPFHRPRLCPFTVPFLIQVRPTCPFFLGQLHYRSRSAGLSLFVSHHFTPRPHPSQEPSVALTATMPATQTLYQVTTPQASLSMQGKSPACYPRPAQPALYSRPVLSPPSVGSSVNTSAVPSLTSGSYAGSAVGENEATHSSAHGVDLIDMMTDRLGIAIDPLPLDRSLARQAQM